MNDDGPRPGRTLLAGALFLLFAGSAWYIAYLRAQNGQLRSHQPVSHASAAPEPTVPRVSAPTGNRTLTNEQREAMLAKLRAATSPDRGVWFATYANNSEAASYRLALQTVFEDAGWEVRGNSQVNFQLKPGLYLMAADDEPPQYVSDVSDALEAAGINVTVGRGYRQFYEEKKRESPNWNGVALAPGQSFVLVVGPKPPA